MVTYHSVIIEAYRAALADWTMKEIDGREPETALIRHTAALASIWTNDAVTEQNVVDVLEKMH